MLEVACAPCASPAGLLLPQPGDLSQRMRSVNNWLAFSLSPHLSIDATDHSNNGAGGPPSGTSSSNANDGSCFSTLGALQQQQATGGTPPHSSSTGMDSLALPSTDTSLCIMEALNRSQQQAKADSWHSFSRPMQTDAHCVQSQHYLGGGGDQHQHLAAAAPQFELKQERDGPKLEDFLGGASLGGGGQYHHHHHAARTDSAQHDLEMYLAGAASSGPDASASSASRINVNLPYSGLSYAGAYHHGGLAMGASDASSMAMQQLGAAMGYGDSGGRQLLSQQQQQGGSDQPPPPPSVLTLQAAADTGAPGGALCTLQSALQQSHHHHHYGLGLHHSGGSSSSQSLIHAALDHAAAAAATATGGGGGMSAADSVLAADCSLQLPIAGGGSTGGPAGISAIKTWLRHHQVAASEKAGGPLASGHHPLQGGALQPSSSSKSGAGLTAMSSLQSLSLSMSPSSQASSVLTASLGAVGGASGGGSTTSGSMSAPTSPRGAPEQRKRGAARAAGGSKEPSPRKSIDTFGQRTSIYRGVTRHRWTGRYEAHLWDNSCRKEGQTRKGRQVYLGGYDKEEKAARAYDLAALKYWGPTTTINFPISTYEKEVEEMKNMTRQEYVASLRRKSSGFSRGASVYRGVTRHHQHGRWQARIGRVAGNKDLYLGTYSTQEEAAEAYDIAAIKFRGLNAVTNFDISRYDTKRICSGAVTISQLTSKAALQNKEAAAGAAARRAMEQQQQQHPALGALSQTGLDHQQHSLGADELETHRQQQQQQALHHLSMGNSSAHGQQHSASSVMKNLEQWQMLYQQQGHRNSWMDPHPQHQHQHQQHVQTSAEHVDPQQHVQSAVAAFSDSLALHQQHQHQQHPGSDPAAELQQQHHPGGMQSAVLRNLMGLDALGPPDGAADPGGCSNSAGFLASGAGSGLLMSHAATSAHAYSPAAGGGPGDSPRNSEGEEGMSKSAAAGAATYDSVMQAGDLSRSISMYMSQSPTGGARSGYDSLGGWTTSGSGAAHSLGLQARAPSMGGHGISPIFAVWNE